DLYREELRRVGDRVEARGPDGWEPADAHVETIAVRDGDPVPVEVVETRRGSVVHVDPVGPDAGSWTALSLRTPSRADADLGFEDWLPLLQARRVEDVEAALWHWVEPVNGVLVADGTGRVRQLVAGRVPVRDERCRREPVPA